MTIASSSKAPGSFSIHSLTLAVICPASSTSIKSTISIWFWNLSTPSIGMFSTNGIAPGAPVIFFFSGSQPFACNALILSPVMWPCTSAPHKIMKRMLGFETVLAITFSIPKFSVLQGPEIAAPAAAPTSSLCEARVTTATGLSGSPTI